MQESKIILTPIPQANGAIKNRPALILRKMPKYQDRQRSEFCGKDLVNIDKIDTRLLFNLSDNLFC